MANIKSAKKRAKQTIVKRSRNLSRRTALKTAVRRVLDALKSGKDEQSTKALLRDAEAKLSRAKGKGIIHANTAARKVSRLAKKVSAAFRTDAQANA